MQLNLRICYIQECNLTDMFSENPSFDGTIDRPGFMPDQRFLYLSQNSLKCFEAFNLTLLSKTSQIFAFPTKKKMVKDPKH